MEPYDVTINILRPQPSGARTGAKTAGTPTTIYSGITAQRNSYSRTSNYRAENEGNILNRNLQLITIEETPFPIVKINDIIEDTKHNERLKVLSVREYDINLQIDTEAIQT